MLKLLGAAVAALTLSFAGSASALTVMPGAHTFGDKGYIQFGCRTCEEDTPLTFSSIAVLGIEKAWINDFTKGLTIQTFEIENATPFTNVRFLNVHNAPGLVLGQTDAAGRFSLLAPWTLVQTYGRLTVGLQRFDIAGLSATGLASAVPEPATWAMMIIGFGLAGSAVRRRRTLSLA